jgi:hypothetical protein
LWYWDLNSGPTPWAIPPALFREGCFWDRVLRPICPGWLQILILLISASWVARITGARYWCPAFFLVFWDRVSLCSPEYPQDILASSSWVLGLQHAFLSPACDF